MSNRLRAPVPPPLLFFAILGAGEVAARLRAIPFLPDGVAVRLGLGLPLFLSALAIGIAAFATFHRHRTSAQFGQPVCRLIQSGPYRYSRNPLYVALVLVLLGFAFVLDNGWLLVGAPVLSLALQVLVVAREERFLVELFGEEYVSYRRAVRSWL